MKSKMKRTLAFILTMLMVLTSNSSMVTAFAAGGDGETQTTVSEETLNEDNTEASEPTPSATPTPATESSSVSTEEETEPSATPTPEAEAEVQEEAQSVEAESAQNNAVQTQADGNTSDVPLDVTVDLDVNDGRDYVQAGESFRLVISYNVPQLGSDQGNVYSAASIQFSLPDHVKVDTNENGSLLIEGEEVTDSTYNEKYGNYTITLAGGEGLASGTHTVTLTLVTENLNTPDNTELILNGFTFNVSYRDANNEVQTAQIPVPSSSIRVTAASDWNIEKSITSYDEETDVSYIRDGDFFEVTYQIKVSDKSGVNRLGRLGFEDYALTDTFPTGLPSGGEAVKVSDVKIIHGSTDVPLEEGTDFDLIMNGYAVTGIIFKTLDTVKEGEAQQFQEVGDVVDTTYEYTVRYPYDPYTTESNQPDIITYEMKNTADMDYTLVGGVPGNQSDSAEFAIGAYEDGVATADISVEKHVAVGNDDELLDDEWQAIYGGAKFTLYTDEQCTTVAYNVRRQQMSDVAVGNDGKAVFTDVRYGEYYIKETKTPDGFGEAAVIKVKIDEGGSVYFGDETEAAADNTVKVVNTAATVGTVKFTKQGNNADGTTKNEALGGVTFTLTERENEYTAVSAQDGSVVFYNIPAGTYTLTETALPDELIAEGYVLSDESYEVEVKANEVNETPINGSGVFLNESPKGYLEIIKEDAQNNKKLVGATFEAYGPYESEEAAEADADAPEAEKAATLVTDEDGCAVSGPLMEGYYVLVETEAPVNYTAGDPQTVEVKAQETVEITVGNNPQAQVVISKKGGENENSAMQELEGAQFEIYDSEQNLLYGIPDGDGNFTDVSTEANGREKVVLTTKLDSTGVSTSNSVTLSPGEYYYKEIEVPAPFKADGNLKPFTVEDVARGDGTWYINQTETVRNILSGGQIKIEKSAADGADTSEALNGAVFGVYASREEAEAATNENRGEYVDIITTGTVNEDGKEINGIGYSDADLVFGTKYYVKELSAPAGYDVNDTIFEATPTDDEKIVVYECTNEKTVSIEIKKTDSITKAGLEGVTFNLYAAVQDDNGNWVADEEKLIATGTTGENGTLTFGDLSQNTTYIIRETATLTGYVLNTEDILAETGTLDNPAEPKEITNDREGTLKLEKTTTFDQQEGEEAPLSGVTFTLYKVADENAETPEADANKVKISEKKTNGDGEASWSGLVPGWYWLVETLPEGYASEEGESVSKKVYVAPGQNLEDYGQMVVEIPNTAVDGKIKIGKYAMYESGDVDKDSPLSDVVFGVYRNEQCTGEPITTLTTGSDGTAVSGWLELGTYYIKETSTLEGYVLSDTVYTVKVEANKTVTEGTADGETVDLTLIGNEKTGGFTIEKYGVFLNSEDKSEEVLQRLSGATFALYTYDENTDGKLDGDGEPKLADDVSDDRRVGDPFKMGSYTLTKEGIAPGVYWLRETATPDKTWDAVDDILIRVLSNGTTQYGTVGEEGVTWSAGSQNPVIELKDYSNKPRIRLTKYIYGTTETLDDAIFELYVADENGEETAVIDGEEIKVSPVMNGETIETIGSGDAKGENGEPIPGEAITIKLEPGRTYYLKEVRLEGDYNNIHYYFDEENCWTKVEIPETAKGEEYQATVYNYERTFLPGLKYAKDDKNSPLGGSVLAVFRNKANAEEVVKLLEGHKEWSDKYKLTTEDLYDEYGNLLYGIEQLVTSNANGQYAFADLVPGETYYILEVVAPNGYELEKDNDGKYVIHEVIVADNVNTESPYYLAEGSFYSIDGHTDVNELAISNWNFMNIELDKVTVLSGQEYHLNNAVFTVYGSKVGDNNELVPDLENIVDTMDHSNDSGQYMSIALPSGTYWIAETGVPEGFEEAQRDKFGDEYDYIVLNGVRYYKVVLSRGENHDWFTEARGHEIKNVATVGKFALTKEDSVTGEKVQATFSVAKYNEETNAFEPYNNDSYPYASFTTSSEDPYVLSEFLEEGIYRLTETGTEAGYTQENKVVYIQIEGEKITDGSIFGNIEIDGNPLIINGEKIQGYLPADGNAATVEGSEDVLKNPIVVTNTPQGMFWIHKTGTWNGGEESGGTTENLEGVKFSVYRKSNEGTFEGDSVDANYVGEITTDENGIAESGLLDAGEYWVIETGVSEDDQKEFGKDSYEPITVTVTAGQTERTPAATTKVENNSNFGKFTVTKKDSYSEAVLDGAVLEIYADEGFTQRAKDIDGNDAVMVDNGDGKYTSPLLAPGNYWLKETKAPAGYYLPEGGIKFGGESGYEVTADSLNDVETAITNDHANTLTILKYERRGTEETDTLIGGVSFELYKADVDGSNWTAVGDPIRTGTTEADKEADGYGTIYWNNLPDGDYILKETSTPDGYVSNTDAEYRITLDNTPEETAKERVFEYSEDIYNLVLGGFELEKTVNWHVDSEDETEKVPGREITFLLYKGTEAAGEPIDELTTDDQGKISKRLEAGDYTLVEQMTEEYAKDDSQFNTTYSEGNYIDSKGNIHIRVEDSDINKVFTGDQAVNNTTGYGRFLLFKYTYESNEQTAKKGLSGAWYTLQKKVNGDWFYYSNGEILEVGDDLTEEEAAELSRFQVTAADINGDGVEEVGYYESNLLEPGEYRVIEVEAPGSIEDVVFTVNPDPIEFTVSPASTVPVEQYDGILRTLRVTKVSDENNGKEPLSGVTFELYKYDDTAENGRVQIGEAKTTGGDGVVSWSGLETGRYVLVETNVPDGYVPIEKDIEITEALSYEDVNYDVTVENESEKGRIAIMKQDAEGNVICDDDGKTALFNVYKADSKELVTQITVSEDGIGESGLLDVGDYLVEEEQAPDGYTLDDRLEGSVLVKKVHVSGDQDPLNGKGEQAFVGVDPGAEDGYTDLVIFRNRDMDSVQSFASSIEKGVRLENGDEGYDPETVNSEASLMNEDVSAWFLISGLTDGKNELPAASFEVTDETMNFQYLAAGSTEDYVDYITGTADDYVMNQLKLHRSVNSDGEEVLATVYAKVETGDGVSWETVEEGINLSQAGNDGYTIALPENTVGFKVSYSASVGFEAGNIEVNVTFKQRASDPEAHEIRRIENTASVSWEDTRLNEKGEAAHNAGTVPDTAAVTFDGYTEDLPEVMLENKITSRGSDLGYYYSGDTVEFETTGTVTERSKVPLKNPVMAITLPPYTTLNEGMYSEAQGGNHGIRALLLSNDGTPAQTIDFVLSEPVQVEVNGRTCWQYVLDFGEDFELQPGQSITLQYGAVIDLSLPDTVITLESSGYIGSAYQLPLTKENPTGSSYVKAPSDSSEVENSETIAGAVGDIEGDDGLTCLRQPVEVRVTRSDSLGVYKSIATEEGEWLNTGVVAEVNPGGTLYYQLSVVNAGEVVKEARFVDIIPFNGDTQEYRSLEGGSVLNRSTNLPESTDEHTYEEVELLWVDGNPDNVEGAEAVVYYYTGDDWDRATRESKTTAEELPMLATKSEDVWSGWTTEAPEDMSEVTAIGVEITFEEGSYLEAGDVYNVTLAMRAPGYTADEMADYENAIIGNTTSVAVLRENDTEDTPMSAADRVSSNEVLAELKMTTGSIGDYAFYDNNNNGIQDDGDRPARNVNVTLERRESTVAGGEGEWEEYASTTTDAYGKYLFEGLTCNYRTAESYEDGSGYDADPTNPSYYIGNAYYEYRVTFDIPDGYGAAIRYAGGDEALDSNIDENGSTEPVTLALTEDGDGNLYGETNLTIDAGFVSLVNLGDYVWIDANKNGIQDESESGLNGVTVNLYKLESDVSADELENVLDGMKPYRTQITASNEETGKDGYYCFTDLPKGLYVVEFDITDTKNSGYTEDYFFTKANAGSEGADSDAQYSRGGSDTVMYTEVIELYEDDMTWDAGVTVYSAIGGFVFDDQDYDDTQSIYIPLPGTEVELYAVEQDGTRAEEPLATAVVGDDGTYLFDKLDAGRYQLRFKYPENYISVEAGVGDYEHDSEVEYFDVDDDSRNSGYTEIIDLPADTADLTHDAGAYLLSSIGDYVWYDSNENGIQDEGELPVSGIIVTLQQKLGDGEWESVSTDVTDEDGLYLFSGLKSSDHYDAEYRVAFGISRLAILTASYQGSDTAADSNALFGYETGLGYLTDPVKPGYGQSDLTIDAGMYYVDDPCTVGDYVWYDVDQDGVQDENEAGVEGIEVILQRCESGEVWDEAAWETVATTVTDSDGRYLFSGIPYGYYRVGFAIGDPWIVTLTSQGRDSALDSNASVEGEGYYYSMSFYMSPGQTDLTWDAGIYKADDVKRPVVNNTIVRTITRFVNRVVTGVATGDPTSIAALIAMLAISGTGIYLLYRRNRKVKK